MPIIDAVWCVVVEWEKSKDQAAALEAVVGSSARWMLETHLDRKAESSAANERVFAAWKRRDELLFFLRRRVRHTVKTTNSLSPFESTLVTTWLALSFHFFLSFSLSGLGFSQFCFSFPVVAFGIAHSPLMARTLPPFPILTQINRLLVRRRALVLAFLLVVIESSLLGRRLRSEVETNDWNCITSPGSRIEDLSKYQRVLQKGKASEKG